MARLSVDKDRQQIRQIRLQVLDEENDIYNKHCGICTKLAEARADDSIPNEGHIAEDGYEYSTKPNWSSDRRNPICEACPIHAKMRDIGHKLEKLTLYDRALR